MCDLARSFFQQNDRHRVTIPQFSGRLPILARYSSTLPSSSVLDGESAASTNPAICAAQGDVRHYSRRPPLYRVFRTIRYRVSLGGLSVVMLVVLRAVPGACVAVYPSLIRPKDALDAHPPCVQCDQLDSHPLSFCHLCCGVTRLLRILRRKRPARLQNAAGESLTNPSLSASSRLGAIDVLLFFAATFRTRFQSDGPTFFFSWANGRGTLGRWLIPEAQNPCFSNAITLFADVRLIEGGNDCLSAKIW